MLKKFLYYGDGMEIRRGRFRGLVWGVALFCCSLLYSPLNANAETCDEIDYNITTIDAGYAHTVGLKEDGTVVAVGNNIYYGQTNVSSWSGIKAIAAGHFHTVGLKEDGTVVAVGRNSNGETNVSSWTGIKAIAAGSEHTVGLRENGTVVAVGANSHGQTNVSSWTGIKAIVAGDAHTIGLKEDDTVVAVGYNYFGQINVSSWSGIKAIAAGYHHTVGLRENGTVVAVGTNWYGQTFNVSSWIGIRAIGAIGGHILGLRENGTVVAVGVNWLGGEMDVSSLTGIKAIAAGGTHTVGLKEDGTVVAVGWNGYGQLNVSDWTNIKQPACLNNPPVANAGSDQVIECAGPSGASVTLNGSGSSDSDNDPLTYAWTWAGGSAEGATPTVILPLGTTEITLTVSDGKTTATDTVNITIQDKTPPITTATGGSNNWYNANVISSFSSTDSCSGVKEVHYTINGTETVVTGDSASLTLTTDGTHNIAYYSIDNAGNAESPNSMTIKIDKTPPALDLSASPNILWSPNHEMVDVLISGSATDAASGIGMVTFSVTDEYGIIQPSISNFNTTIQLEASREGSDEDGRLYTISAVASDAAGNKTTAYTTVLVPHDQGN